MHAFEVALVGEDLAKQIDVFLAKLEADLVVAADFHPRGTGTPVARSSVEAE